jgi:hypothetical protein
MSDRGKKLWIERNNIGVDVKEKFMRIMFG